MWLLGGTLQGGRIAGRQTVLTALTLYQSRDLPVLNDYRVVAPSERQPRPRYSSRDYYENEKRESGVAAMVPHDRSRRLRVRYPVF